MNSVAEIEDVALPLCLGKKLLYPPADSLRWAEHFGGIQIPLQRDLGTNAPAHIRQANPPING